jgi:hypothetical protein
MRRLGQTGPALAHAARRFAPGQERADLCITASGVSYLRNPRAVIGPKRAAAVCGVTNLQTFSGHCFCCIFGLWRTFSRRSGSDTLSPSYALVPISFLKL